MTKKRYKVYVSGKISGIPESDSRELFRCGCSVVSCCGHIPINPWDINIRMPNASYEELMAEDLRTIREEADAVYMLCNWKSSPGAIREHEEAKAHGLPIYYDSNVSSFFSDMLIEDVESRSNATENSEVEEYELSED